MNPRLIILVVFFAAAVIQLTPLAADEQQPPQNAPRDDQPAPMNSPSVNVTDWLRAVSGIGVLAIAIIVAVITYQQHITNREKLRLDLFDKRYRVYDSARYFLNDIFKSGDVTLNQINQFQINTGEAVFLFPKTDIDELFIEMRKNGHSLMRAKKALDHYTSSDPEFAKANQEIFEITQWYSDQYPRLVNLFAPYLRFKK